LFCVVAAFGNPASADVVAILFPCFFQDCSSQAKLDTNISLS
jgi:hypothetical protein